MVRLRCMSKVVTGSMVSNCLKPALVSNVVCRDCSEERHVEFASTIQEQFHTDSVI